MTSHKIHTQALARGLQQGREQGGGRGWQEQAGNSRDRAGAGRGWRNERKRAMATLFIPQLSSNRLGVEGRVEGGLRGGSREGCRAAVHNNNNNKYHQQCKQQHSRQRSW
jgi:hypothetical protein